MKKSKDRNSGFTLIELLAITATITILGLTLLPAIAASGRDSASIHCLNNLKQIGRAMFEYAEDNEGRIPRGEVGDFSPAIHVWFRDFSPYLGEGGDILAPDFRDSPVYKCPNYPEPNHAITYANNAWLFTSTADKFGNQLYGYSLFSEVEQPNNTIYLVDFASPTDRNVQRELQIEYFAFSSTLGTRLDVYAPEFLPYYTPRGETTPTMSPIRRVAVNRHATGSNALYLDGHADYLDAMDISDIDLWRFDKP